MTETSTTDTPRRGKGLVLFSGGLDSLLAALILRDQGCHVECVTFTSPFFGADAARRGAAKIGVELHVVDFTEDILALVRHPSHGFGGALNPCIDCHARMIQRAFEMVDKLGWDFVATGEVLNQRPMSQTRSSLGVVSKDCGDLDRLIRPLSALLLEPTRPEREGLVDRSRFFDINGRTRKVQHELAERFGLGPGDYPSSGGGCLLTEKLYCNKLKDLRIRDRLIQKEVELLKTGRHFRISNDTKCIVGRNENENKRLEEAADDSYYVLNTVGVPGAYVLAPSEISEDDFDTALRLCAGYSDAKGQTTPVTVRCRKQGEKILERDVVPLPREEARNWML